jgi:hypothetical protein
MRKRAGAYDHNDHNQRNDSFTANGDAIDHGHSLLILLQQEERAR